MNVGILINARLGSTRLPRKHLLPVQGKPILKYLIDRIQPQGRGPVIIATSDEQENKDFDQLGIPVFYGDIHNIPLRQLQCARFFGLDAVVSVDGDDILCSVDGIVLIYMSLMVGKSYAWTSGLPFGLNSMGYTTGFLAASVKGRETEVLETNWAHVFDKSKGHGIVMPAQGIRFSLDYPEDYDFFCKMVESGSGTALWQRAKRIIPGGNGLLSKRSERFLPDIWPAYYKKADGCEVWDLDGRHYYDFAQMGVGSCALGYRDYDVNRSVIEAIDEGNMASLNCPEEVELAEKLVGLHPWADMAKFARTGGEACAMAIRIARAYTGRDKVAFCGYHGWHDWYLAANIGNESALDGQLLPGLEPAGVPRGLKDTTVAFRYNNFDDLEEIVNNNHNLAAIIMEPVRSEIPTIGFLESIKRISEAFGAVLIFDEITSGFRMNTGGIHMEYGVEPDMAVFGKALGNGYPISAVIGRRDVMEAANNTFISSTMWTERTGFAAALATISKYERENVTDRLIHWGNVINDGWQKSAKRHGIRIKISGIPPLTHIEFLDEPLPMQTLYAQEMLERGFLAGASVYTTYAYTRKIVDEYLKATDQAFKVMAQGNATAKLRGGVIQAGFKRLA